MMSYLKNRQTALRKYTCPHCPALFAVLNNLKLHVKNHVPRSNYRLWSSCKTYNGFLEEHKTGGKSDCEPNHGIGTDRKLKVHNAQKGKRGLSSSQDITFTSNMNKMSYADFIQSSDIVITQEMKPTCAGISTEDVPLDPDVVYVGMSCDTVEEESCSCKDKDGDPKRFGLNDVITTEKPQDGESNLDVIKCTSGGNKHVDATHSGTKCHSRSPVKDNKSAQKNAVMSNQGYSSSDITKAKIDEGLKSAVKDDQSRASNLDFIECTSGGGEHVGVKCSSNKSHSHSPAKEKKSAQAGAVRANQTYLSEDMTKRNIDEGLKYAMQDDKSHRSSAQVSPEHSTLASVKEADLSPGMLINKGCEDILQCENITQERNVKRVDGVEVTVLFTKQCKRLKVSNAPVCTETKQDVQENKVIDTTQDIQQVSLLNTKKEDLLSINERKKMNLLEKIQRIFINSRKKYNETTKPKICVKYGDITSVSEAAAELGDSRQRGIAPEAEMVLPDSTQDINKESVEDVKNDKAIDVNIEQVTINSTGMGISINAKKSTLPQEIKRITVTSSVLPSNPNYSDIPEFKLCVNPNKHHADIACASHISEKLDSNYIHVQDDKKMHTILPNSVQEINRNNMMKKSTGISCLFPEINIKCESVGKVEPLLYFQRYFCLRSFRCKYCRLCFNSFESYSKHKDHHKKKLQRIHFKTKYVNERCMYLWRIKPNDLLHADHDKTCGYCGQVLSLDTWSFHKAYICPSQNVCQYCGRLYKSKKTLRNHESSHFLSMTPYKCLKCGREFAIQKYLEMHIKMHYKSS